MDEKNETSHYNCTNQPLNDRKCRSRTALKIDLWVLRVGVLTAPGLHNQNSEIQQRCHTLSLSEPPYAFKPSQPILSESTDRFYATEMWRSEPASRSAERGYPAAPRSHPRDQRERWAAAAPSPRPSRETRGEWRGKRSHCSPGSPVDISNF